MLLPVYPPGAQYESCDELNDYVALDIVLRDPSLVKLFDCLKLAAEKISASSSHPIVEELSKVPIGQPLSERAINAAAGNEGILEDINCGYLTIAQEHGLVDLWKHDPALVADDVLEWIYNSRQTSGEVSLYRHSWRIKHHFLERGWHIYAPWIVALSAGALNARHIKAATRVLNALVAGRGRRKIASILANVGMPRTHGNFDLIWFLCANRYDLCVVGSGESAEVWATEGLFPNFGVFAELALREGWVRNPSRSRWHKRGMPCEVEVDQKSIAAFFRRSDLCPPHCSAHISTLAVKVALWQVDNSQLGRGDASKILSILVTLLGERGQIVKITDLRRHLEAPTLRIDPYSIDPGRLLVYAPSQKFLEPDNVSFALREWVQDEDNKRARISVDRILTPLNSISWPSSEEVFRILRGCRSFQIFGIALWSELRRKLHVAHKPHAARWVDQRLYKHAQALLKRNGLIVIDGVIFSSRYWHDLPPTRAGLRIAGEALSTNSEWQEHRRLYKTEISSLLDQLIK